MSALQARAPARAAGSIMCRSPTALSAVPCQHAGAVLEQGKAEGIPTRTADHALAQAQRPMDMTRTGLKPQNKSAFAQVGWASPDTSSSFVPVAAAAVVV